jgi:hypothetical protein
MAEKQAKPLMWPAEFYPILDTRTRPFLDQSLIRAEAVFHFGAPAPFVNLHPAFFPLDYLGAVLAVKGSRPPRSSSAIFDQLGIGTVRIRPCLPRMSTIMTARMARCGWPRAAG